MANNEKALRLLGLALHARRLEAGEEPVVILCRSGKARLVLLASDAGEHTLRRAENLCRGKNTPLLVAPDGRKLSKREGDLNMEALRQKYTPEQLTGKLAKLAGLRPTDAPVTAIELAADFSWDKVPRADIPIPEDF